MRMLRLSIFGLSLLILLFLLMAFLPSDMAKERPKKSVHPKSFWHEGLVISVYDGDSITLKDAQGNKHKIRLYGIDCPEKAQKYGKKAGQKTREMLLHKKVVVEVLAVDRYKRHVALVYLQENAHVTSSVQERLLSEGLAWVYPEYCKSQPLCNSWKQLQKKAATSPQELGLWQQKHPLAPWQYRKMQRNKRK